MFYTTERLLASVKRRCLAPISQKTFQDADLIALANEELTGSLVPDIVSIREDFFLRKRATPIVAGVNHYALPERAIGDALKDVFFVNGTTSYDLSRQDLRSIRGSTSTSSPSAYTFYSDEILLDSTPGTSTGNLEFWYLSRVNELVATSSVAKITGISSSLGSTTFTVDTDLTTQVFAGDKIDALNAQSPFFLWAEDVVVTGITSTTVTVATSDVSNEASVVTPGLRDYICPARTGNIPMVPEEFHPILSQMVACRLMEGLGDATKLQAMNAKLGEMRRQAFTLVANRAEDSAQATINRQGITAAIYKTPF